MVIGQGQGVLVLERPSVNDKELVFIKKLYHPCPYFGRSSISLKTNICAKSSGVRAFTSHVWGMVLYVTAQSVHIDQFRNLPFQ